MVEIRPPIGDGDDNDVGNKWGMIQNERMAGSLQMKDYNRSPH